MFQGQANARLNEEIVINELTKMSQEIEEEPALDEVSWTHVIDRSSFHSLASFVPHFIRCS